MLERRWPDSVEDCKEDRPEEMIELLKAHGAKE